MLAETITEVRARSGTTGAPAPLYLPCEDAPAFAVYHGPRGEVRDLAVLICPPFGWEEVCSHRVLREWARRLAASGFATLRWTLPGAGDSAGTPQDDDLFDSWMRATDVAARWLRAAAEVSSVVTIGLGLGGMLAYVAAASGTPLDGFALWGVPNRGRTLVREMRAFSRLESSEFFNDLEPLPTPGDVALEAGGFMLSAATLERLEAIDLRTLQVPPASLGALVLERDGVPVDERFLGALRAGSMQVSTALGEGYAAMSSHPQHAEVPEGVVAAVGRWLEDRVDSSHRPAAERAHELPRVLTSLRLAEVTETPFELELEDGRLSGILATPAGRRAPVCAVFLNGGAQRRIGPNRMWVEAARRWARHGVASLRFDMLGIGESDGPTTPYRHDASLYRPEMVERVRAVLDDLQSRGVGTRFILVGLCAGAYWALDAGIADPRVESIMAVNPAVIVWDHDLSASRDLYRVFSERSWRLIRKNATPARVRAVARMLTGLPARALRRGLHPGRRPATLQERVDAKLKRLLEADVRMLALFASREGLAMDLERSGRMEQLAGHPNVTVGSIPVNDHTLRPVAVQRLVHGQLDAELARTIARLERAPFDA